MSSNGSSQTTSDTREPEPVPHGHRGATNVSGYRHEAFFWRGDDDFLARTVPFVLEGLEAGDPVMVAVTAEHVALLRAALGAAADRIVLEDMERLGANPARIIPEWRDFVEAHGRPVRGIGEPIWSHRRDSELTECQLHEALLNVAIPPDVPLWLLCPYDTGTLPEDVIDEARRSHPVVVEELAVDGAAYGGHDHVTTLFEADLAPVDERVPVVAFQRSQLGTIRSEVEARAAAVGLAVDRGEDLALAVHEVAVNSIEHGGGRGDVRIWDDDGSLVIEVRDGGHITDAMVGRRLPSWEDDGGRGLWLANQLCDLVQVRSRPSGTTVRIHTWL